MFRARPLPLPSRDLLGGRRTRWRHCDWPRTGIASASAAVVVSSAVVGAAIYGGTAMSDPGAPQPRRPTDCRSGGATILISHGHTIQDTTRHLVDVTRGDT